MGGGCAKQNGIHLNTNKDDMTARIIKLLQVGSWKDNHVLGNKEKDNVKLSYVTLIHTT